MKSAKFTKSIPLLVQPPPGTLIYGLFTLQHRLSGATGRQQTSFRIFGTQTQKIGGAFPGFAQKVSEALFGGALTPVEVLHRHTLFGFYSKGLDPGLADQWAAELVKGNSRSGLSKSLNLAFRAVKVRKEYLCYCVECSRQELSIAGYSLWKGCHQLPGVCCCHLHKTLLTSHCSNCQQPLDSWAAFTLPGDPCRHCGANVPASTRKAVPAAVELSKDCEKVLVTDCDDFRPISWASKLRRVVACSQPPGSLQKELASELKRAWQLGDKESKQLAMSVARRQMLVREIESLNEPLLMKERLVVLGSLRRLGLSEPPSAQLEVTETYRKLERYVASVGLPVGICNLLLDNASAKQIEAKSGIGSARILAAIRGAPRDLRSLISRKKKSVNFTGPRFGAGMNQREVYREKVRYVLENFELVTRTTIARSLTQAIRWMRVHDAKWLEKALPPSVRNGSPLWGRWTREKAARKAAVDAQIKRVAKSRRHRAA